jgi:hypothetical protein|tara:strand:+ start:161 stop:361 length:201 start_codon:yes stop_codon:yes gene_type:complete
MSLYAKVNTTTNIIESVGNSNITEAGYNFKEFIPSVAWGAELVGFEVSTNPNTEDGFPYENLFVSE